MGDEARNAFEEDAPDGKGLERETLKNVRMLVDKGRDVVDLVVDDNVEILLGRVFCHLGVGEFLRHG